MEVSFKKEIEDLIYILTCTLNDRELKIERIQEMDLNKIYELASTHSLAAMVALSLERAIPLPYKYDQAKKKALRKIALFDYERSRIFEAMDKQKIWYMPLKGIVLENYYPQFGMREMSDNDILCDYCRSKDVKQLMEQLGYSCDKYEERVDDYYTKPPLAFEMHRFLFDERENKLFFDYYKNIKNRLILVNNGRFEYKFSLEDFYIYQLAHEYKHYIHGGIGLRSLVDSFIFLKKYNKILNWSYIFDELKILNLSQFEENNRELVLSIFSDNKLTNVEKENLLYFVTSGTHGTQEHFLSNVVSKKLHGDDSPKSKRKYLIHRLFIQGSDLEKNYPFFAKHAILIPFLQVFRLFKAIFIKPKEVIMEYKSIKHFNYNKIDNQSENSRAYYKSNKRLWKNK